MTGPVSGYDILLGESVNPLVSAWTAARIGEGCDLSGGVGFGALRGGRLVGAVVFTEHRGPDVRVSFAGYGPWLSRRLLRTAAAYAYRDLGCRRMTAVVRRANRRSRRIVEKLGFRLEGVCREAFEDGESACIYGMTRDECRWLEPDTTHKEAA